MMATPTEKRVRSIICPSLWPSGIGSRLGRNMLWVRFLAVSDIYPMFIEPTITWVPSGLWVHMAWHKNCVKKTPVTAWNISLGKPLNFRHSHGWWMLVCQSAIVKVFTRYVGMRARSLGRAANSSDFVGTIPLFSLLSHSVQSVHFQNIDRIIHKMPNTFAFAFETSFLQMGSVPDSTYYNTDHCSAGRIQFVCQFNSNQFNSIDKFKRRSLQNVQQRRTNNFEENDSRPTIFRK